MRIEIVNDVAIAAEALRRVIVSVASYQVAWIATDGLKAVEKCKLDTPDLILMDLFMPEMDGVEATRRIMAQAPCPILLVTSAMEEHCGKIFEALGAGALDVTNNGNKLMVDGTGSSIVVRCSPLSSDSCMSYDAGKNQLTPAPASTPSQPNFMTPAQLERFKARAKADGTYFPAG